ncbi:MAG TPA: FtsX-like permease family protein [Ktedonobacteraceae bacterium]|jgi:ABC-type lipoprotein release transport system permease subunit|nr:FtsX-like permease family protein [Ktedonobacteraceae bacterium]
MGIILRGIGNVLRNPVRLILVVVLLGASLMFVAAMVSLNSSAQQQLTNVHKDVGTTITINYAQNDAGQFGGNFGGNNTNGSGGGSGNGARGGFGGGSFQGGGTGGSGGGNGGSSNTPRGFGNITTTPIPSSVVTEVAAVSGVASTQETLRRSDTDNTLKTTSIQGANGNSFSLPPTVYGMSPGDTQFTLGGGSTLALTSGKSFTSSDASANVAMMGKTLAASNNLKVGSTFTLKGKKLTIVGLFSTGSDAFSSSTIVLPLKTMQTIYAVQGVDSITAHAATYEQVPTVTSSLQKKLGSKYDVVAGNNLYQSTFNALNVAQNSITLALYVSIAVAAIVIIFAVFVIVRERTVEIGTLKAIGASHWQVIRQFWGEVFAMSALGSIVAIILLAVFGPMISQKFNIATPTSTASGGAGGGPGGFRVFGGGRGGIFSQASSQLRNIHLATATLNLETLLIIVGLGIALAVITSIIPAWYVARIKPAVVLRRS